MGIILTHGDTHTGLLSRLMEQIVKDISESLQNMKAQHDSWHRFHQTAAGRNISRRAWMRHGAMLEQLSTRSD